jgi:hypothetical protein
VTAHPEYLALGPDAQSRGDAYCRLFDAQIDDGELETIRNNLHQGSALGGEEFRRALESTLGRAVEFVPQGRPTAPT